MTDLFGENENPWDDIWMPLSPTYNATRDAKWKVRPMQRELALRQKDVYERNKTELLTGGAGAGGAGTSASTANKMAATMAARVNSSSGSIERFTSVYKTSGGGAKKLRGATTTRKLSKGILRKKHTSSGTNPPGVSLNRLELKKQMRYFFRAKIFCVLKKNVLGKFLA